MPRKPSKSGMNKLLASETTLLSGDPLIGLLELNDLSDVTKRRRLSVKAFRFLFALLPDMKRS
jgi:hypothetical protein